MRTLSFILGFAVLAFCVAVPLPAVDANMPFSDHMIRHTALLLLAAPLLAMAIPASNVMRNGLIRLSRLTARLPAIAWLAGIAVMWLWHVPSWYNATAGAGTGIISCAPLAPALFAHGSSAAVAPVPWISLSRMVPLLHDASLVLAGFLFSWPVIAPYPAYRLPPLRGVLYLASACICCSLLGLMITFAPSGTFRGVSMTDQQTGGMIMWIPCCVVYLTASMCLLIRWLSRKEAVAAVSI